MKIHNAVKPVHQKLHLLFHVRNTVSKDLNCLLAAGIIECIDSSAWVSLIVITHKKWGQIIVCIDLHKPNKAVIVDAFPLPPMDKLLPRLKGALFFLQLIRLMPITKYLSMKTVATLQHSSPLMACSFSAIYHMDWLQYWHISKNDGYYPHWSVRGRELFGWHLTSQPGHAYSWLGL